MPPQTGSHKSKHANMHVCGCLTVCHMLYQGTSLMAVVITYAGEVNGKAGNVNNAMRVIYKDAQLSADDVLAIFDCDQVCNADFFVNTLPLMAESGDISMVCCMRMLHAHLF